MVQLWNPMERLTVRLLGSNEQLEQNASYSYFKNNLYRLFFFIFCVSDKRVSSYSLKKEVTNMLVKINSKPIRVIEEEDDKEFSWVYLTVSCIGYAMILWIMDYCCFVFFSVHLLPFIPWLVGVLKWLF